MGGLLIVLESIWIVWVTYKIFQLDWRANDRI